MAKTITPIEAAAGEMILAIAERLASSTSVSADDVRQGAAEVFGAERLAFRLRDEGAVALLRAAGDTLSTIAARPEQWPRLLELRRELATSSRNPRNENG
jgi:hypothetical protein